MPLRSNPDFLDWLARFRSRHEHLGGATGAATACDGCGEPLTDQPASSLPYCIVCLAEQYGRDRAEVAAGAAAALRVALATAPEPPAPDDVRAAVQVVLDEYEDGFGARGG